MIAAIVDGVIILLLTGSIAFGYVVSRKVKFLTESLKDLEPLVEAFSSAVDKSHYSVVQMRENIATAEKQSGREERNANEEEHQRKDGNPSAASFDKGSLGLRVVRDKKELVRAFFDNADTAKA